MIKRSREAEAFLESVHSADATAVSRCDGWTTHEIVAHVAGIAVEVDRHLEPYLQGDSVPETRGFEEREAPLRAMQHDKLLDRLEAEEERMRTLVADVLVDDPNGVIKWTGREMAVAKFIPHLRNEHALHRWDVIGDDDEDLTLLGQLDLIKHSVDVLGRILLLAGQKHDPTPDSDFCVRLHADGDPDLSVVVDDGQAELAWADDSRTPSVDMDAAARHLFIWGRRPEGRGRLYSQLTQAQLTRLQALLSGY